MGINSFSLDLILASRLSFNQPLLLKGVFSFFSFFQLHKSLNFVDSLFCFVTAFHWVLLTFMGILRVILKNTLDSRCRAPYPLCIAAINLLLLIGINLCPFVQCWEEFKTVRKQSQLLYYWNYGFSLLGGLCAQGCDERKQIICKFLSQNSVAQNAITESTSKGLWC